MQVIQIEVITLQMFNDVILQTEALLEKGDTFMHGLLSALNLIVWRYVVLVHLFIKLPDQETAKKTLWSSSQAATC